MSKAEETDDFNVYLDQNPRKGIPNKEMEKFLEYAVSRYKDWGVVNWCHIEDEPEEVEDEVKDYIGNSMEALLLYKEWIGAKGRYNETYDSNGEGIRELRAIRRRDENNP